MNESDRPFGVRLVAGVAILALGLLWTADNLELVNASQILRWWPALLLLFGVSWLAGWGGRRSVGPGVMAVLIGILLLAHEAGWTHAGLGLLFPIAMVAVGVLILVRGSRAPSSTGVSGAADAGDFVHSFALMGGASTRSTSQALRGAELSAVMGGVELDLREAKPTDGPVVVDAFAFMGGIDLVVPPNWSVEFHATPVMGSLQDARGLGGTDGSSGTVLVRGVVVLGGFQVLSEPSGRTVVVGASRRSRRERYSRPEVHLGNGGLHVRTTGPHGVREVRIDSSGLSVGPPPPAPPPPPPPPTEPR